MNAQKKVAIVMLNYNGWKDTIECFESVFRIDYDNFCVILCDNHSADGSVEKINDWLEGRLEVNVDENNPMRRFSYPNIKKPVPFREYKPETDSSINLEPKSVILINAPSNLGFPAGNNIGIQLAMNSGADYLLLLNNDTVVEKDFMTRLVEASENDPKIGICGSKIYYYYEREKIWAAGGGFINPVTSRSRHFGLNETDNENNSRVRELDYITGCSLLIKREVVEKIGILDGNYYLYNEESDWALWTKRAGYKIMYNPQSKLYHKVSAIIGRDNLPVKYYFTRNPVYFARKNYRGVHKFVTLSYLIVYNYLRSFYHLLIKKNKDKSAVIRRAVNDALSGKMGEYRK